MTTPDPRVELSDRVVARLRTAVPAWWGSLAAWLLLQLVPYLPGEVLEPLAELLTSAPAKALVMAGATLVWYALWRWASPIIPDWLVRLALGSTRDPVYPPAAPVVDGVPVITNLQIDREEADSLHQLYVALSTDMGDRDPTSTALAKVVQALER